MKILLEINEPYFSKIKIAIYSLAENPRPFGYRKLVGSDAYRIRVGDYRIIYEINDNILLIDVIDITHRNNIYE